MARLYSKKEPRTFGAGFWGALLEGSGGQSSAAGGFGSNGSEAAEELGAEKFGTREWA